MKNLWLIGWRNLFGERSRILMTASSVAFSVILILIVLGLYQAWQTRMTQFLETIPAQLWVGQKDAHDMTFGVSVLPQSFAHELEGTDSVDRVIPLVGRLIGFTHNDERGQCYLIGVENSAIVHPYQIKEGRMIQSTGELVIDESLAKDHHLRLGDHVSANGLDLKIVGITQAGNLLVYSYAFADIRDARQLLNQPELTSFFLIQSKDPAQAAVNLRHDFPQLEILDRATFLNNNADLIRITFLPIVGILVIVSYCIGIAVIGLTIYTATLEKSSEYAILKAIGYTSSQLAFIILFQALIAGLIGYVIGILLAPWVAHLANLSANGFIYEIHPVHRAAVLVATLAMSFTAAFLPLKRILQIDPVAVFRT